MKKKSRKCLQNDAYLRMLLYYLIKYLINKNLNYLETNSK